MNDCLENLENHLPEMFKDIPSTILRRLLVLVQNAATAYYAIRCFWAGNFFYAGSVEVGISLARLDSMRFLSMRDGQGLCESFIMK